MSTETTTPAPRHTDGTGDDSGLTTDPAYNRVPWEATYIPPCTPYHDEPSAEIPAGWHIHGRTHPDNYGHGSYDIHITQAFDDDYNDVAEHLARHIVALLNAGAAGRAADPKTAHDWPGRGFVQVAGVDVYDHPVVGGWDGPSRPEPA